jgi:hypothetical protein
MEVTILCYAGCFWRIYYDYSRSLNGRLEGQSLGVAVAVDLEVETVEACSLSRRRTTTTPATRRARRSSTQVGVVED